MKTLIFDIETLPADDSQRATLSYLYNKKSEKFRNEKTEEEFFRETALDGGFGRILCIAHAVNDGEIKLICNSDERTMLKEFWDACVGIDLFVGHNIMDFDFKFIYQRSIVLGVKPTRDLNFARYRSNPIYDTMKEWIKWSNNVNLSLEYVALALGIPSPKSGIDGSQVYDFYLDGKTDEICEYCERDVDATREVYKRMNFSD